MVEIKSVDSRTLARAVALWTGYDSAACPTREDGALRSVFPANEATKLATIVRALEDDFYKSQAHFTAKNLSEMKDIASSDFRRLHPELPEEIANAFAWCYTFDYK